MTPADPSVAEASDPSPRLAGIVVHWRAEAELAELVRAWPPDPRFELIVVDNSLTLPEPTANEYRLIRPAANLGFSGGVNAGVAASQAPWVLLLNPDARPEPGASEALLQGLEALPKVAGLAPRLLGEDGEPQYRWQLRPLPNPWTLLWQALGVAAGSGPAAEPAAGSLVEQPAAAALLLSRQALEAVGGLDESFYPAWFEDVDLARRLRARGLALAYWPAAVFRHGLGASVPQLGYGPFLWVYHRSLLHYLGKHHGALWRAAGSGAVFFGGLLRLAALLFRRPRRARSRGEAASGLAHLLFGVVSGWRRPSSLARRFARPQGPPGDSP